MKDLVSKDSSEQLMNATFTVPISIASGVHLGSRNSLIEEEEKLRSVPSTLRLAHL